MNLTFAYFHTLNVAKIQVHHFDSNHDIPLPLFQESCVWKSPIKNLHPHKLRHSFASIAITSGADVASVSEILGHSDKAVTLRMYTHADEKSKKRASSIYRNALQNAGRDLAKNA